MARRFPLEGLLRARRLAEESAAAGLEVANGHRRAVETAVADATERLASVTFDEVGLSRSRQAAGSTRAWHAAVATRAAAATHIADLEVALETATTAADEATTTWGEARMRVAMIEKLGERHEAKVLAEELADEQLALDEAALRGAIKEDEYR